MKKFILLIGLIFVLIVGGVVSATCEPKEVIPLLDHMENFIYAFNGEDYEIFGRKVGGISPNIDLLNITINGVSYESQTNGEFTLDDGRTIMKLGQDTGTHVVPTHIDFCMYLKDETEKVENNQCIDSDGGLDYYVKGMITVDGTTEVDFCLDDYFLQEKFCDSRYPEHNYDNYYCPDGCKDGACIRVIVGESESKEIETYCCEKTKIGNWCQDTIESNCDSNYRKSLTFCKLASYCRGVCRQEESCIEGISQFLCESQGGIWKDKPNCDGEFEEEGEVVHFCGGCELDDKCYPIGYRTSKRYCAPDGNFVEQEDKKETCHNNFECKSNVCISNECISEGLIKKILNWFRKLFG